MLLWCKANWRWLLACCITILGGAAAIALYIMRKGAEARRLQAAIAISRARAKVEGLEAVTTKNDSKLSDLDSKTVKLDAELAAARKDLEERIERYNAIDIAEEFKKRGY